MHVHIPDDLRERYEIQDYRHAAAILACEFPGEHREICGVLRTFRFTESQVQKAGGNESEIPKEFARMLGPLGWKPGQLKAKLVVDDQVVSSDTHKIDFLKNRIAFDLEWNSKDQTLDRDLYAFRAFFEYGKISMGIPVTRSQGLDAFSNHAGCPVHVERISRISGSLQKVALRNNRRLPVPLFGMTDTLLATRPFEDFDRETKEPTVRRSAARRRLCDTDQF